MKMFLDYLLPSCLFVLGFYRGLQASRSDPEYINILKTWQETIQSAERVIQKITHELTNPNLTPQERRILEWHRSNLLEHIKREPPSGGRETIFSSVLNGLYYVLPLYLRYVGGAILLFDILPHEYKLLMKK